MIAKAVHHLTRPWWRPWWRAERERASVEVTSGLGVVFENMFAIQVPISECIATG
jgi:hypothetical protein